MKRKKEEVKRKREEIVFSQVRPRVAPDPDTRVFQTKRTQPSSRLLWTLPPSSATLDDMETYSADAWKALGRAVRRDRERRPEYADTKDWAAAVKRSSRQVLELERGGRVGANTLRLVEKALGWPEGRANVILRGETVHVTDTGEVLEMHATSHTVIGEDGEVLGEVSEAEPIERLIDREDFDGYSDSRLAKLIEEIAGELQRRANTRTITVLGAGSLAASTPVRPVDDLAWAADHQVELSEGQRRRDVQGAVGEESQVEP